MRRPRDVSGIGRFVEDHVGVGKSAVVRALRPTHLATCGWTRMDAGKLRAAIDRGADAGAVSGDGWTPATRCCALETRGDPGDLLEVLLDAGADPAKPNGDGLTPLMLATLRGHRCCIRTLLQHGGADVAAVHPRTGMSAFMFALRNPSSAKLTPFVDAAIHPTAADMAMSPPIVVDWAHRPDDAAVEARRSAWNAAARVLTGDREDHPVKPADPIGAAWFDAMAAALVGHPRHLSFLAAIRTDIADT